MTGGAGEMEEVEEGALVRDGVTETAAVLEAEMESEDVAEGEGEEEEEKDTVGVTVGVLDTTLGW